MLPLSPEGGLATADVMASLEQGAEDTSQRLHAVFDRFMAEQDVTVMPIGAAIDKPSASWFEAGRLAQDTLGGRGRMFELIVVGRPIVGQFAPSMVALETALFESGRPLLIVPPGDVEVIGRRIAIAWNGSTETARTIAFAMPLFSVGGRSGGHQHRGRVGPWPKRSGHRAEPGRAPASSAAPAMCTARAVRSVRRCWPKAGHSALIS